MDTILSDLLNPEQVSGLSGFVKEIFLKFQMNLLNSFIFSFGF